MSSGNYGFEDRRFFKSPARSLGIKDPWIVFDEIHIFLIVRGDCPVLAVEVKSTDQSLSRPLAERKNWISTDQTIGVHLIGKPGILRKYGDYTWVVSADCFLALLN